MRCHLLGGEFIDRDIPLSEIVETIASHRFEFLAMSTEDIVALLDALGREMVRDKACASLDGASYISLWLRRANLERLLRLEYGDPSCLDRFVESEGLMIRAHPRGVACHWVANNVTTLGFFSLMLAVLSKNLSLVKASAVNKDHLLAILKVLGSLTAKNQDRTVSGMDMLRGIAVVTFEGRDLERSSEFSLAADARVVWGGADSVQAIETLPRKGSCETVIFGPKYSFAVMDKDLSSSPDLTKRLAPLAKDVVLFDQMACSSPQVLFVERGGASLEVVAEALAKAFSSLPRLSAADQPEGLCAKIINARWTHMLAPDKGLVGSDDLSWSILIGGADELPEPVHGRCLFLKEMSSFEAVCANITGNVQAVELLFDDQEKRLRFAEMATAAGADRAVSPGGAHNFGLPWDGMKVLGRMVRWVTLK